MLDSIFLSPQNFYVQGNSQGHFKTMLKIKTSQSQVQRLGTLGLCQNFFVPLHYQKILNRSRYPFELNQVLPTKIMQSGILSPFWFFPTMAQLYKHIKNYRINDFFNMSPKHPFHFIAKLHDNEVNYLLRHCLSFKSQFFTCKLTRTNRTNWKSEKQQDE